MYVRPNRKIFLNPTKVIKKVVLGRNRVYLGSFTLVQDAPGLIVPGSILAMFLCFESIFSF